MVTVFAVMVPILFTEVPGLVELSALSFCLVGLKVALGIEDFSIHPSIQKKVINLNNDI